MPYTDNGGVRIHYQTEGSGPPLVLQHGFTSSIEGWYEYGYVDVLKRDYQLILIDARGHGASDKPHDAGSSAREVGRRCRRRPRCTRRREGSFLGLFDGRIGSGSAWPNLRPRGSTTW